MTPNQKLWYLLTQTRAVACRGGGRGGSCPPPWDLGNRVSKKYNTVQFLQSLFLSIIKLVQKLLEGHPQTLNEAYEIIIIYRFYYLEHKDYNSFFLKVLCPSFLNFTNNISGEN